MRVLLDENVPHDLAESLVGRQVVSVQGLGWAGVKYGELLRRAASLVDALITMDRNLEHQQSLAVLSFGIVLLQAPSNRVQDLVPLVGELLSALERVQPGRLERVG